MEVLVLTQRFKKDRKNDADSQRHLYAITDLQKTKSSITKDTKTQKLAVMVGGKQYFLKEDV